MLADRVRFALIPLLLAAGCAPGNRAPAPAAPASATAIPAIDFATDSARVRELAPGVIHRALWSGAGPWAVHVVEAAPGACRVEVRTRKAGGAVAGRATTSVLAREGEAEFARPVLAALNADFFLFDPPGVPVGAQVAAGEVVRGPAARPVFAVTEGGAPFIGVVQLAAVLRSAAGARTPINSVNTRPTPEGITLYNRYAGERTPADTGVVEVMIRPVASAGDPRGVVAALDTAPEGVGVPAGGVVLAGRGSGAAFLRSRLSPGDTVSWSLGFAGAPGPVREMVGGHPALLHGGEGIETSGAFSTTRHPRTAIGWRADGTLLLVVVDGRQPGYSMGMSLPELTDLFRALGAVEALNLDGGGSTTLVVAGRVANRPSDPQGERPVANALLLVGAEGEGCRYAP